MDWHGLTVVERISIFDELTFAISMQTGFLSFTCF